GQETGAEQHRMVLERDQRPCPRRDVRREQQREDGGDLAAQVAGPIVARAQEHASHRGSLAGLGLGHLHVSVGMMSWSRHHPRVRSFTKNVLSKDRVCWQAPPGSSGWSATITVMPRE